MALDIDFGTFAVYESYYSAAFTAATSAALGINPEDMWVSTFSASSIGTTVVFFDMVVYGTDSSSSAVIPARYMAVQGLFQGGDIGSPATDAYIAALQQFGIPLTGAYYNDQLTPTGR